ncbi:DUF1796 family putative cysteine peptidase [uncultured Brachyspira sp.]|uniref:DUF1796 family putative cysteine peptidase n=1 Tax=uncultured Brachyspira sp. TaxID=221953 RepID=UPI002606AB59|nr:DUF1796 family putative cysteine peptidase [uncultured Brachyspira sp.]
MDKNLINKVVWWIPFKNIRNLVRNLLFLIINIDSKINTLNKNINELNNKINSTDANFNELNNKIDSIDNKINTLSNNINGLNNKVNTLNNSINAPNNINKLLDDKVYEYDFIFSIGDNCFPAEILRDSRLKLRKSSSPLDWVYGGNIYKRLEIVNNKFNRFMEFEDLFFSHIKGISFIYRNKYTGLSFPHEFKSDKINNDEYLLVKEKYERRINRTLDYLYNSKILMVYTGARDEKAHEILLDTNKIINMMNDIRKNYNNNNIDLLYIQHYPYKDKHLISFKNINNTIHLYSYNNSRKENERIWIGNTENTIKVLRRYRLTK